MARNPNTKKSGKSPGTGEPKSALIEKAKALLKQTLDDNKIAGNPQVELPVGKNFVVKAYLPMTFIIYQGHTESSLATAFTAFMDDAHKIYASPGSTGGTNAEGVADRPLVSRTKGSNSLTGKKVTIILPERYPVAEIGGNLGSRDGGEGTRRGRQVITWRVPTTVPLLTVGLFLYAMNSSAPKATRQIREYTGPRGSVVYLVPATTAEKTEYEAGLAKMEEAST